MDEKRSARQKKNRNRQQDHEPKISRFFSGSRFPLATLSSIEDQMFFLAPSLLDGRLPDLWRECWLKVDSRCPIPTMLEPVQTIPSTVGAADIRTMAYVLWRVDSKEIGLVDWNRL